MESREPLHSFCGKSFLIMPIRKSSSRKSVSQQPEGFSVYFEPVKAQMEMVRKRLCRSLMTDYKGLNRQLESIGVGGGKLFRPALVLLSGRACGSLGQEHIELAALVELVHTATLLHDDVIDKAGMRRGGPTANVLWGNTAAVLQGDFLLSKAFLAGAKLNIPTATLVLGRTAEKICRGELLQNLRRGDWRIGQRQYLEIIQAKTASLFEAGCYLAALGSGADKKAADLLAEYGRCVGLAFQITDDILDITGDSSKAGKTLRTDLAQGKLTLPVIHFLRSAGPDGRNKLKGRHRLALLLEKSGSLKYARRKAADFATEAVRALGSLRPGRARNALEAIAVAVGRRT